MDSTCSVHIREPDSWIVEKAWQGNEKAFDKLITRYRSRAVLIAQYFCEDKSLAYGIARKAFILTLLSAYKLRTPHKFLAYLVKTIEDISEDPHSVLTSDEIQVSKNFQQSSIPVAVRTALIYLPEDLRILIVLKDMCDFNYTTLATLTLVSEQDIADRLAEARKLFCKHYVGSGAVD